MTFVIVDRNAIHSNDQDGGDRPAIVVYDPAGNPRACTELDLRAPDGTLVARFKSQSLRRPVDRGRPHVWLELVNGVLEPQ